MPRHNENQRIRQRMQRQSHQIFVQQKMQERQQEPEKNQEDPAAEYFFRARQVRAALFAYGNNIPEEEDIPPQINLNLGNG